MKNNAILILSVICLIISGCKTTPGDAASRSGHPKQAADLYREGAKQGDANAALKLGLLLDKGEVNASNYGEAKIWFERACELGQVIGCHNLGVAFEYGKNGCQKNYDKARKYYFKAANAGYMHSQYNLGSLYSNNYFANDIEGYKWMLIAKKTGEACSSEPICKWVIKDPPGHRSKLENRLSPSQVESVKKAASSWVPTKQ